MIEHAVYASARSHQRDGYQVVASSLGARPEDLRELAVWCPSHDGLLDTAGTTPSLNGFPVPSGAYCVARSFAAAAEYSGRGGIHAVTHALFLPAADYLRFANNPFAVLQAALAAGKVLSALPEDRTLLPFQLVGRARPFDRGVVRQVTARDSLQDFLSALDACLQEETTILAVDAGGHQWMAALLNCLPLGLRAKTSLATALVYSPRRPYEWLAQPPSDFELRRLERNCGVRVVNLAAEGKLPDLAGDYQHAWTRCVQALLAHEDYLELERILRELATVDNSAELDSQASQILKKYHRTAQATGAVPLGTGVETLPEGVRRPAPLTRTW
jgi:hypothetical protein